MAMVNFLKGVYLIKIGKCCLKQTKLLFFFLARLTRKEILRLIKYIEAKAL